MIIKASALALVCAASAFILRGLGWRGVPILCAISFVGLISFVMPYLSELSSLIKSIAESSHLLDSASAALKVTGVGYLGGVSADICRELDCPSGASAVILVARIEIIGIVAPFFVEILRMGKELIG